MKQLTTCAYLVSFWLIFAYGFTLVCTHIYHNLLQVIL